MIGYICREWLWYMKLTKGLKLSARISVGYSYLLFCKNEYCCLQREIKKLERKL